MYVTASCVGGWSPHENEFRAVPNSRKDEQLFLNVNESADPILQLVEIDRLRTSLQKTIHAVENAQELQTADQLRCCFLPRSLSMVPFPSLALAFSPLSCLKLFGDSTVLEGALRYACADNVFILQGD